MPLLIDSVIFLLFCSSIFGYLCVSPWCCVNGVADANTVVMAVERLVSNRGGLTVVLGRPCNDSGSLVTTHDNSALFAVFTREIVSQCHIERDSVVAIHPPWLSSSMLLTYYLFSAC